MNGFDKEVCIYICPEIVREQVSFDYVSSQIEYKPGLKSNRIGSNANEFYTFNFALRRALPLKLGVNMAINASVHTLCSH